MSSIIDKVQKIISDIYRIHGSVSPSQLIEAARPKNSPIHDAFEWDDKKAGDEYRLIQARKLIRRVEVVYGGSMERLVHVPVISGEGYYKPAKVIVENVDEFSAALAEATIRLRAAKESFLELKTVADEFGEKINHKQAERGFSLVEKSMATGGS